VIYNHIETYTSPHLSSYIKVVYLYLLFIFIVYLFKTLFIIIYLLLFEILELGGWLIISIHCSLVIVTLYI